MGGCTRVFWHCGREFNYGLGTAHRLTGYETDARSTCLFCKLSGSAEPTETFRLMNSPPRGPQSNEWLSIDGDGLVVHELRRPFRDGTTQCLFEPLDFLARLAALVPRPGTRLIRYHGVSHPTHVIARCGWRKCACAYRASLRVRLSPIEPILSLKRTLLARARLLEGRSFRRPSHGVTHFGVVSGPIDFPSRRDRS